jgi:hypothetical protein
MHRRKALFVGAISLLAANHLGRCASTSAAEPVAGETSRSPATQAAAAGQADDVVRASALLAEFSTAKSDGKSSPQPATQPPNTLRSGIDIGRDLMNLSRSAVPLLIKTLDDPDPEVSAVAFPPAATNWKNGWQSSTLKVAHAP